MNTRDRALHLSRAATQFPFLGETTAEILLALLDHELGSATALDEFVPRGRAFARASGPGTILHIVSGNTPAAGLQSLIRGLLLGAHNLCKVPSAGMPELAHFRGGLPQELAARVEISTELPAEWLARADALIVFGADATVAHFRARARADQLFIGHGHKISFGVVFSDPANERVAAAARDVTVFDQQGCLSPHAFYVAGDARAYAARLAEEMRRVEQRDPRGPVGVSGANSVHAMREDLHFRAANGEPIAVWASEGSTAWTVAFEGTPGFPLSPLHRFVFVKPLPADMAEETRHVRPHLLCAGIWPATLDNARLVAATGVTRICPIGEMQIPPWTWRPAGQPALASLVRWVDVET